VKWLVFLSVGELHSKCPYGQVTSALWGVMENGMNVISVLIVSKDRKTNFKAQLKKKTLTIYHTENV
jgi:hypothetical protein